MATYTSKDLTAQRPAFDKLRAEYVAANKAAKLAAVHQRARDLIQAPDLAIIWQAAHFGAGSVSGYYNVQGKTQAGAPRRGGSPYAAYYTLPSNAPSASPSAFIANADAINASVDMTLGARLDQYLSGWANYLAGTDYFRNHPWPLNPYTYTDEKGASVTVRQTAPYMAMKMASINAAKAGIAGQQAAAQAFADAVLAQAPAWYQPALVYINTITTFKPRVAVASAARNLSGDVRAATDGLDKLKAAIGKAAAADQPTSAPGGGTTEGQRQQTPPDEGKSNLLLVLGIAAAAGAVILLLGDEKAGA
jgi:hypothetical protein